MLKSHEWKSYLRGKFDLPREKHELACIHYGPHLCYKKHFMEASGQHVRSILYVVAGCRHGHVQFFLRQGLKGGIEWGLQNFSTHSSCKRAIENLKPEFEAKKKSSGYLEGLTVLRNCLKLGSSKFWCAKERLL